METEITPLEIRLSTPFQMLERKPNLKLVYKLQSERSAFMDENIPPDSNGIDNNYFYKKDKPLE